MNRDRAIVLHVRPYKDSDAIVSLFAERAGRCSVYLRGLRSTTRKDVQRLQPFYELSLDLGRRAGADLMQAKAIDVLDAHLALSADLVRSAAAHAVVEAGRDLFHDNDPDHETFALMQKTLRRLETAPPYQTLNEFIERLLALLGYEIPEAEHELVALVGRLEKIAGRRLTAHRFFLEVA